jgi:hypothetical protein
MSDNDPIGHALQMYAYYGTVSWQILGIFVAVGFVLATLPFVATSVIAPANVFLFHFYGVINEGFAAFLVIVGYVIWNRYQGLAEKWACYPNIAFGRPYSLSQIIDAVENVHLPPRQRTGTGRLLALTLFGAAIVYVFVAGIFIFLVI